MAFIMLSENAMELAFLLRSFVGQDGIGVGPDVGQLVECWGDRDPSSLRPAMDELATFGFLNVNEGIGTPYQKIAAEYGLRGVVGVQVTRAMQEWLDQIA